MTERRRKDITFMQVESLRLYRVKHKLEFKDTSTIFKKYNILQYILENYEYLHLMGMPYVIEEIDEVIANGGGVY